MEVILLDKVINLGGLGDQVSVKAGYARNFLIPKGKAVPATRQNSALFEARRAELRAELARTMAAAQARLDQLKALEKVTITAKAGAEGKLFGSISTRDIANAITAAGIEIKKHEIKLPHGLLRTVGEHEVDCQLYSEIHTRVKVHVVANT